MHNNEFKILFRRWLTSIDKVSFFVILCIISIGIWISISSTPSIAIKLGLSPFAFFKQHIIIVPISICMITLISFLQTKHIRKLALLGYFVFLLLIIATLFFGVETKGARRWLNIFGFSVQPSEFIRPALTILTAWLIAEQYRNRNFPGVLLSVVSVSLVVPLLLLQPDLGMTFLVTSSWIGQLFISGVSIFTLVLFGVFVICSIVCLYFVFPHVADRINNFLCTNTQEQQDLYQVTKSLEAFKNGGLFGKGPGEGVIKTLVPDSHSDFVFSVIGEEFGFVLCFAIIVLFLVFIIRSFTTIVNSSSIFNLSAVFGMIFQMIVQILINISTSLNIIPTKGMTLPFISYGGSSFITSSITVGIILAITKKNSLTTETL